MNVPSLRSVDTGELALARRGTRTRAISPPTATRSLPPQECKVYTPQLLADAMVRAINPEPDDLWLDPCTGPGAFISALRNSGLSNQRIVAVDIDPCPSPEDGAATTVRGVDFFAWCAWTKKRFTKVVANPPYVALCKLGADLQKTVRQFHDSENPSFALRSNYWCAFLSACLGLMAALLLFCPPLGTTLFMLMNFVKGCCRHSSRWKSIDRWSRCFLK